MGTGADVVLGSRTGVVHRPRVVHWPTIVVCHVSWCRHRERRGGKEDECLKEGMRNNVSLATTGIDTDRVLALVKYNSWEKFCSNTQPAGGMIPQLPYS